VSRRTHLYSINAGRLSKKLPTDRRKAVIEIICNCQWHFLFWVHFTVFSTTKELATFISSLQLTSRGLNVCQTLGNVSYSSGFKIMVINYTKNNQNYAFLIYRSNFLNLNEMCKLYSEMWYLHILYIKTFRYNF
jgi:hypothetical protein